MCDRRFLSPESLGVDVFDHISPGGQVLHVLDERQVLEFLETGTRVDHGRHDGAPLIFFSDEITVDLLHQRADSAGLLDRIRQQIDEAALDIANPGGLAAKFDRRQLHQAGNAVRGDLRAPREAECEVIQRGEADYTPTEFECEWSTAHGEVTCYAVSH